MTTPFYGHPWDDPNSPLGRGRLPQAPGWADPESYDTYAAYQEGSFIEEARQRFDTEHNDASSAAAPRLRGQARELQEAHDYPGEYLLRFERKIGGRRDFDHGYDQIAECFLAMPQLFVESDRRKIVELASFMGNMTHQILLDGEVSGGTFWAEVVAEAQAKRAVSFAPFRD
ncbi:hypothetical protein SAMN05892883_2841 [Jatrophihabitans sp. GAS493]|uniref:hypothetical protein n=1 Tax=Jatrophihabitans sp. GAS493 TaxID=1907575 RepID=UPI000BB91B08|nr:hypothetical protein [Jatrophihabitans sp. GAS493]SOD73548.1 hypothetical protein SAMN05892883_2841 [Jatrophihabitans sp. GAS493]